MMPALRLLADRVASRLRAKYRPGRTVTVRVRFGNLRSVTRSVTLDAPISATVVLAEIAEELVRKVLAQHPDEKTISLVAISVSQLQKLWDVQLELPLGLEDEERRPGSKRGMARWMADRAIDMIRDRFGREAIGTGQSLWKVLGPYPTSFANSPKRTSNPGIDPRLIKRAPGIGELTMPDRAKWIICGANGSTGRSEVRNAINRLFFGIIR